MAHGASTKAQIKTVEQRIVGLEAVLASLLIYVLPENTVGSTRADKEAAVKFLHDWLDAQSPF